MYMRASGASELRKFLHFHILKLLFLSIFCWYFIRYVVGTKDMLVGLSCTGKFPNAPCPPPPLPPLATLVSQAMKPLKKIMNINNEIHEVQNAACPAEGRERVRSAEKLTMSALLVRGRRARNFSTSVAREGGGGA